MRLAPFVPLPKDSLRYRLAYFIENFLEHPDDRSERLATMSCWQLGYRIAIQLGLVGFLVVAFAMGLILVAGEIYFSSDLQWFLGAIFGFAILLTLWEGLRISKRLHILRRRLCPMFIVR